MNNKGFMMAEVVVVSSVILVTLTGLYISYGKILSIYNQRVNYYDATTLYELAYIREAYKEEIKSEGSTGCVINEPNKKVYNVDIKEIKDMIDQPHISPKLNDYFKYLSTSINTVNTTIIVMERCEDTDNCKYGYLEVFD